MKTLKLALIVATLIFASCSNKDDDPVPAPESVGPELTYTETKFTTTFHTEGNSGLPVLDWNGEIGNLSLSNTPPGVKINEVNGTVSWKKSLPLGTNTITAVAINSTGQKAVVIEIENAFQGGFQGSYNHDPLSTVLPDDVFSISFDPEGGVKVKDIGGFTAEGAWTRDGNTITAVYNYTGSPKFFTIKGELTYNNQNATLKGYWYQGNEAIEANKEGYIVVKLN